VNKTSRWFFFADSDPNKVDLIFTFGGEQARENHAMRLMDKYFNAKWIVSSPLPLTKSMIDSGYWKGRVTVIEHCKNTLDEVNYVAMLCSDSIDIALLSGPYHLRRIERFLRNVLSADCGSRFHFVAVPLNDYNTTKWHLFKLFVLEMQKMIYYSFQMRLKGI